MNPPIFGWALKGTRVSQTAYLLVKSENDNLGAGAASGALDVDRTEKPKSHLDC